MSKILILLAQDICHGLLDSMAYNLGREISLLAIESTYFDIKKEAPENIVDYIDNDLLGVIDFYSGILNIKLADGNNLFDVMGVPIYQFLFDYPIYVENILGCRLNKYRALCMDEDYISALDHMYGVSKASFFPIPGKEGNCYKEWSDRSHDIVFVGVYSNYRDILSLFDDCEEEQRKFAADYFNKMVGCTHLNHMEALKAVLDDRSMKYDNNLLYRLFLHYGKVGRAARAYIREKMIKVLLDAGFEIDVYSDSWNNSVWEKYDNLVVHDVVNEEEYLNILGDSKISLNCLYGNKAGYTERHGNSMLNGAISVTDRTEYLAANFEDQENIVFYDLDNMVLLPEKVRWILDNKEKARQISLKAKETATEKYTWKKACSSLMELLISDIENDM